MQTELRIGYDIIIDGSDNFSTRYLVNDYCVINHKPFVYGSIYQFEGQVSVFDADQGPCYRCIFPTPPPPGLVPTCGEGGVFGVLPGTIGTMQATEAIKLILGIGESAIGKLFLYDALDLSLQEIKLRKIHPVQYVEMIPKLPVYLIQRYFVQHIPLSRILCLKIGRSVLKTWIWP